MRRQERISKVLSYIRRGSAVADIGCDHGYVLIQGILQGIISKGIGVEVRPGPMAQALSNVREAGLEERVELRLGSGLSPLSSGEAEVCVIGGMGGHLIREILEADPDTAASFRMLILQPMNGERSLREYLFNNGWRLVREEILELDRPYLYLVAERGQEPVIEPFLQFDVGPLLRLDPSPGARRYLEGQLRDLRRIREGSLKGKTLDRERLERVEESIRRWEVFIHEKR